MAFQLSPMSPVMSPTRSSRYDGLAPLAVGPGPHEGQSGSVDLASLSHTSTNIASHPSSAGGPTSTLPDSSGVQLPAPAFGLSGTGCEHAYGTTAWYSDAAYVPETQPMYRQYLPLEGHETSHHRNQEDDGVPAAHRPYGFSIVRETLFVLVICLAQAMMLAGMAQSLVLAYVIGQSFPDTNAGTAAWYSAAYGLTSGTPCPAVGPVRRRIRTQASLRLGIPLARSLELPGCLRPDDSGSRRPR